MVKLVKAFRQYEAAGIARSRRGKSPRAVVPENDTDADSKMTRLFNLSHGIAMTTDMAPTGEYHRRAQVKLLEHGPLAIGH